MARAAVAAWAALPASGATSMMGRASILEPPFRSGASVPASRQVDDGPVALGVLAQERAQAIGQAALKRVLAEHTYDLRGAEVDALFQAHKLKVAA